MNHLLPSESWKPHLPGKISKPTLRAGYVSILKNPAQTCFFRSQSLLSASGQDSEA